MTPRPRAAPRPASAVRHATRAVSAATAALVFLPVLFLLAYAVSDESACDGLGGIGVVLAGWFAGLLAFGGTVITLAIRLRRARLLLVLPVAGLHYVLAIWDPLWPPTMRVCGESLSLLVPALLVALAGGATYALARDTGA